MGITIMMMRNYLLAGALLATVVATDGCAAAQDVALKVAPPMGPTLDYKTTVSGSYVLDNSHASVVWKVWHMGLSHFAGRFDKITGAATVNAADVSKSGVVITIDSSSADTNVAKLDDELDGAEFFDAEKYPAITFTSTKIEVTGKDAAGRDTGKIYGMLSLRGVTKPIALDATFNGHGPNPMNPLQERMGFEASTTIKRSEFGFTKLIPVVSDDVQLIIAAEFTKL